MDVNTSPEVSSKKTPLEELPKEELIKRCKNLLVIAQKAKQVKDSILEENVKLIEQLNQKEDASCEIIENLTQQKLELFTNLTDVKQQKNILNDKLVAAENKISELDTENQGYKRQVVRLTDENEELISHLEQLEKQIEELKLLGLQQQEQLLELEKNNTILTETNNKIKSHDNEGDKLLKETKIEELEGIINKQNEEISKLMKTDHDNKQTIQEQKEKLDKFLNSTDDLNVELHRNRALIENLKRDLSNTSNKLSESQIMSSGVATDLQNSNEKLKEKLQFCHSKMIKLASSVKALRQEKNFLLEDLKEYTNQVNLWKSQLHQFLAKYANFQDQHESEIAELKKQNDHLKDSNKILEEQSHFGEEEKAKLIGHEKAIIEIEEKNKVLTEEIDKYKKNLEEYEHLITRYKDEVDALTGENVLLKQSEKKLTETVELEKKTVEELDARRAEENRQIEIFKELYTQYQQELEELKSINEESKNQLNKLREDCANLIEENVRLAVDADIKQMLQQDNENLKDKLNIAVKELQKLKESYENLKAERHMLNEQLKTTIDEYNEETKILKDTLEKEKYEKKSIEETNSKIQEELVLKQSEIENISGENQKLHATVDELKICKSLSEEQIKDLRNELDALQQIETSLAVQSGQEIEKLVQQNNELLRIAERYQNLSTNDAESQTFEEYMANQDELNLLKREKSELLAQMNEMNQALKERGETISQQEAYCNEMFKKIQVYEVQANKKEERIKSLEEQLNGTGKTEEDELVEKDAHIAQLQLELEQAKERLGRTPLDVSQDNFADNETMSTSTISRTEETNRLKDLEGSWEERYGKLRNLATKMKGKIRDLTADLNKEQSERNEVQNKLTNSLKTIHTLQVKCDKLEDDLESTRKEAKSYLKKLDAVAVDISKDKQNLAQNDEVIVTLKHEIEELKKEKVNIDTWKKQVGGKVQSLKKELEANNVLKKDYETRITKLQQELESKEQALKNEIDQHKVTMNSLQESNNECKKKSVLSLEMQDYERSVKELSQKLDDRQEIINQLKNQLDSNKSTSNALREQNKVLEERLEEEETDLNNARVEINMHKKKINEFEDLVTQKEDKIHSLTRVVEESRLENEELSRELSKVIAEHQKNTSGLKNEVDRLRRQVLGLEQRLREVRDALKLKEEELKMIEKEYSGYKVRAQSVLRQNQTRDIGTEEKLSEEAASLKAQILIITEELNMLKERIGNLNEENEVLVGKHDEMKRNADEMEAKMLDDKLQYEKLKEKYQRAVAEQAETVRGLKLHAETLSQCYRQQLSEQEVRHNREIIEMQSKLNKPPSPTEPPSLMFTSMTREEGEGSESVESTSSPNNTQPVSLEKLLNNDSDQELSFVKKQLFENESKVAHLADLLADTEQDLAKHVQMNNLLKEEIRRQQRSVEREEHAENLEYLKNVVLKFVTLNNSDERLRLVPVMNTILKLSPDETNKLNTVAKGEAGAKGWSNYLPLSWPSQK